MPIKLQSVQNIPYLLNHRPYSTNADSTLCETVNDMISVDLQAYTFPVEIDYLVGASDNIKVTMELKNLTLNANISVNVIYDNRFFVVDTPSLILLPEEQRQINVILNKDVLDVGPEKTFETSLRVEAKNMLSGQTVIKKTNASYLSSRYLPQKITVI